MRRTVLAVLATLPLLAACATEPPQPLRVVFFTEDSALISPTAQQTVNDAAAAARSSSARVTVRGFAGPAGGQAFNRALSEARAQVVRDGLVSAGVPAQNIIVQPRGPVPFEAVPTESRRVEIAIGN
ncbi:OmpA family protein [Roseomonas sp. CCTCC AB2023176]|uniref:OmpA family protein n=1 Tax=Roseomonas sp. CCTCC AB2023176 TaxID=3342640 RepID=UPI0035DED1F9